MDFCKLSHIFWEIKIEMDDGERGDTDTMNAGSIYYLYLLI